MADAPKFRATGQAKEFITRGGVTYLVMKFPDNSVLVLRRAREKGTKGAAAAYEPLGTSQREVLRRLGASEGTTYEMGRELLK